MTRRIVTKMPEYASWYHMKSRCLNPNNRNYKNYGGRGIKVCDRWMQFMNFLNDMGEKPSPKHSIERIDNSRDYEPTNCRWATYLEQQNNKKNTTWITYKGRTQSIKDWCRELGFNYRTMRNRFLRGWSPEQMFEIPKFGYPNKIRQKRYAGR